MNTNDNKTNLGEDGMAATTTASIPVKIAITQKMQKEYTDKNAKTESAEIKDLVPPITPSAMTTANTPIKKKAFLEHLVDSLTKKV